MTDREEVRRITDQLTETTEKLVEFLKLTVFQIEELADMNRDPDASPMPAARETMRDDWRRTNAEVIPKDIETARRAATTFGEIDLEAPDPDLLEMCAANFAYLAVDLRLAATRERGIALAVEGL